MWEKYWELYTVLSDGSVVYRCVVRCLVCIVVSCVVCIVVVVLYVLL